MRGKPLWSDSEDTQLIAWDKPKKITFVFGTRPEAIKLAPLIKEFKCRPSVFTTLAVATGQHREMLDQALGFFGLTPDYDLDIMAHDQSLSAITVKVLVGLEKIIVKESPDLVIVQGDTTTAFVGTLAAFYHQVPVAHIEAGLRTGNRFRPFPEEVNRRLVSVMTDLHFAATAQAGQNLIREAVAKDTIWVVGNTVVDALVWALKQPYKPKPHLAKLFARDNDKRILVTVHRRENYGRPMLDICRALLQVVKTVPGVRVIFPMHCSPGLRRCMMPILHGNKRIHVIPPLDYQAFVHAMKEVNLIMTDSGGIQEEAPYLGTPVLVLREETERPEGVMVGAAKVVGTDPLVVADEVRKMLGSDLKRAGVMCQLNVFGDGQASARILGQVINYFNSTTLTGVINAVSHSFKL